MNAISANDTGSSAEANMPPYATCAPDLRSRIYALSSDLTMLVGMIEGAAVIYDAVDTNLSDPVARRAARPKVSKSNDRQPMASPPRVPTTSTGSSNSGQ